MCPFEGLSRSCLHREGIKGCSRWKEQNAHNTQRHKALRNREVQRGPRHEVLRSDRCCIVVEGKGGAWSQKIFKLRCGMVRRTFYKGHFCQLLYTIQFTQIIGR